MAKKYKVIQWASGLVGKQTLLGILRHPDLELVGMWVHSEKNAGIDAGKFCGEDSTGVITTTDREKLLSMDADCVCYLATDLNRSLDDIVDDICGILESGKNVVGTQASLGFPALLGDSVLQKINMACQKGGSSYFPTGINPNGSQAVLASIASLCQRVESTYICEMYNFEDYEDPSVFGHFGYGLSPVDARSHDLRPLFEYLFGPALHLVAHWFGVKLDEVRWDQEIAFAEKTIELPNVRIEAGTVSAIRFNLDGMVDGKCRVTQGGCYWVGAYPSHWQSPPGSGGYRIAVKGDPDMKVEWRTDAHNDSFRGLLAKERHAEGLAIMGGLMGTAARTVNSIPELCRQVNPGIHTLADQSPLLPKVDWKSGGRGDSWGATFGDVRVK